MANRIAFVSDIHSNLEALTAVLEDYGPGDVYCLGDVVGYGGSPNEVVELLRGRLTRGVIGNHDNAVLTEDFGFFNARAAMGGRWTAGVINVGTKTFLGSLPKQRSETESGTRIQLVHGSPDDPLWEYVDPSTHEGLFPHYLRKLGVDSLALGHTHIPFEWDGEEGTVFNPGSVGQPRDGNWRASYAVATFEHGKMVLEHRRVEYDREEAARKIRRAGLPEQFAERLSVGR